MPYGADESGTELGVSDLAREFTKAWWECPSTFPDLGDRVLRPQQRDNERRLRELVNRILADVSPPPRVAVEREQLGRRLAQAGRTFVAATYGLSDVHIDFLQHSGFVECGKDFARLSRAFDPLLSPDDLFQASRNVWTMNGIQHMLGLPVKLTPSVFAYSLLYPYTDNLLDDPSVPEEAKAESNRRLCRRIAGEDLLPVDSRETAIWRLLQEIETEHPRAAAPRVYASLQAIHSAQCRSLLLLRRFEPPYGADVLGIAIEKGGASVLTDACLVSPTINGSAARFFFGLGSLLQLADDLQDVEDDRAAGLATLFTHVAGRWPLDRLTSRLFHFRETVLTLSADLDSPGTSVLLDLLRRATHQLLLDAAGRAHRYHSPAYARKLEAHLPCRPAALNREKQRLSQQKLPALALLLAEDGSP